MSLERFGDRRWKPKAFRPNDPPSPEDVSVFVDSIGCLNEDIVRVYSSLAALTPAERFQKAVNTVVLRMPCSDVRDAQLTGLLMPEEYEAYVSVAQSTLVVPRLKVVAEGLLCVPDRYIVSSFFRRAFAALRAYEEPLTTVIGESNDK